MGMSKPVHVLQRGAGVEEIVNIAAVAVVDAQEGSYLFRRPASVLRDEDYVVPAGSI
jgi:malate dehydrogenase (oxaloacetate-decarboxylating)(NADP+)